MHVATRNSSYIIYSIIIFEANSLRLSEWLSKGCYLKISIYIAAYRFRAISYTQCMYIDWRIGAEKRTEIAYGIRQTAAGKNMTRENAFLTNNTVVPSAQLVRVLVSLNGLRNRRKIRECEIHISYMFHTSYEKMGRLVITLRPPSTKCTAS